MLKFMTLLNPLLGLIYIYFILLFIYLYILYFISLGFSTIHTWSQETIRRNWKKTEKTFIRGYFMILFSFKIGIEFESRELELFVSKLKITLKTEMKIRQFNFRFWTFQNNKFETKTSILQIVELISNFKLVFTLYLLCHNILFFRNSN